jgi:hypothetical protein
LHHNGYVAAIGVRRQTAEKGAKIAPAVLPADRAGGAAALPRRRPRTIRPPPLVSLARGGNGPGELKGDEAGEQLAVAILVSGEGVGPAGFDGERKGTETGRSASNV